MDRNGLKALVMVALVLLIAHAAHAKCRAVHRVQIQAAGGNITIDAEKDVLMVAKNDCVVWVVASPANKQYAVERVQLIAEDKANDQAVAQQYTSAAGQKDFCVSSAGHPCRSAPIRISPGMVAYNVVVRDNSGVLRVAGPTGWLVNCTPPNCRPAPILDALTTYRRQIKICTPTGCPPTLRAQLRKDFAAMLPKP
jgi:hypothetical protein